MQNFEVYVKSAANIETEIQTIEKLNIFYNYFSNTLEGHLTSLPISS